MKKSRKIVKFRDPDLPAKVRVEDLISRMTLEEKIAQLGSIGPEKILEKGKFSSEKADKVLKHGIGQITRIAGAGALEPDEAAEAANAVQRYLKEETRLGIPAILHEECLSGFMGKRGTTYPQSIGNASSWEPELIERITTEIRSQLKAVGAHLALSPVADVARDMRWGRVEETFGEDQYLVAVMVAAYVRGLQADCPAEGIYATLKHFAGHGFSEGGRNHAPVNISPRELRENFLLPFEVGVKEADAGSIMNAYHDIDGIPCAASSRLLTDILRGEWGFDGIVVSDYFSIEMLCSDHMVARDKKEAGILALEAGLDIELPETECYGGRLLEAVNEGRISEAVIDRAVQRHLTAKFRMGLFEDDCYVQPEEVNQVFETPDQRVLAREAARKSAVLLKNEDDLLPLDKDLDSIAVVGPSADSTRLLLGDYAYSAHVDSKEDAVEIVTIREGMEAKVSSTTEIKYARGCGIMDLDRSGFDEAVIAAEESEVAVVVLGGKSGL
ncbi:MAG: glycoside hydrolase family 3 N-terminal domain-containing protein, partial [Halanaerobiales bacterium]